MGNVKHQAIRTGYICGIDFDCDLGYCSGGTKIYSSIDDLKRCHPSWKECGIVEVEVKLKTEIRKGKIP